MAAIRVNFEQLEKFVFDILHCSGFDAKEAKITAEVMVWTDLIGRSNHGLKFLPIILKRFRRDLIKSPCHPEFEKRADAIYVLRGNDGLGQFLSHLAMAKAIDIADERGIGLVGVQNSNHFGAGAYYMQMAAEKKKISLVTSNSVPRVVPHGGSTPVLGTNPFAFGAPVKDDRSILVDFSTGAMAGSTIRKAIEDGKSIPEGLALDRNGNDTVDPKMANDGSLLPMAGAKGFCMGLMVEILSAIITGSASSHEIGSMLKNFSKSNRVGHFILAINVPSLMPLEVYYDRMETLIRYIKESRKKNDVDEILYPGEGRWRHLHQNEKEGVQLADSIIAALQAEASKLNLAVPW
jgi:LDH2 family malate/lactate/ureidoglycolate dehydrogenase